KELFRKIDATVVYVTHDQIEALTLSDRVAVLNHGKIQQIGTPEDLYHRPENSFVASFIGSPSMNIFEAKLSNGFFQLGGASIATTTDFSGDALVGIRPEAVGSRGRISARVEWAENLGPH